MLDRELLEDIGFELGHGWDGECWVYEGMFWVYYFDYDTDSVLQNWVMDGRTVNRKEFFGKFIEAIERRIRDSATVTF